MRGARARAAAYATIFFTVAESGKLWREWKNNSSMGKRRRARVMCDVCCRKGFLWRILSPKRRRTAVATRCKILAFKCVRWSVCSVYSMFPCRNFRGRINSDVSTLSWKRIEIYLRPALSRYIHLLMAYEHLTSRGDDSPKGTEI